MRKSDHVILSLPKFVKPTLHSVSFTSPANGSHLENDDNNNYYNNFNIF